VKLGNNTVPHEVQARDGVVRFSFAEELKCEAGRNLVIEMAAP
jgi:hypothetical protein